MSKLGATSINKIGEVQLSNEIGNRGGMRFEIFKNPNYIINIKYEIPSRKFRLEAEILGIFSIEVAP